MQRRKVLLGLLGLTAVAPSVSLLAAANRGPDVEPGEKGGMGNIEAIEKSKAEWQQALSEKEFYILREEGTEPAGSSPLLEEKRTGTFVCAACSLALFESQWKFDSGTGWPSFYTYIDGHLGFKRDWKMVLPRTEYHCARCGGHQGHVFDDGPEPTGKRYCNNGLALDFQPA